MPVHVSCIYRYWSDRIILYINLPGVLKTGLPEILSQVQHIAGNLPKLNLLKALTLFSVKITISLFRTNHPHFLTMGYKQLPGIDRNQWKFQKICTRGVLSPLGQLIFFEGGFHRTLSALLLHRHRAIICYAFGVAWLNSRGVGLL